VNDDGLVRRSSGRWGAPSDFSGQSRTEYARDHTAARRRPINSFDLEFIGGRWAVGRPPDNGHRRIEGEEDRRLSAMTWRSQTPARLKPPDPKPHLATLVAQGDAGEALHHAGRHDGRFGCMTTGNLLRSSAARDRPTHYPAISPPETKHGQCCTRSQGVFCTGARLGGAAPGSCNQQHLARPLPECASQRTHARDGTSSCLHSTGAPRALAPAGTAHTVLIAAQTTGATRSGPPPRGAGKFSVQACRH